MSVVDKRSSEAAKRLQGRFLVHRLASFGSTRLLGQAVVIVIVAACAAWCQARWFLPTRVDLTAAHQPKEQREAQTKHALSEVTADEVVRLMNDPRLRLVDARSRKEYVEAHIPLAFSIPAEQLPESLRVAVQWLAPEDMIVVYCEGNSCGNGWQVASALAGLDYKNVHVFTGGWMVWKEHNRQIQQGQPWYEDQAQMSEGSVVSLLGRPARQFE